jgi:hypothetical protein
MKLLIITVVVLILVCILIVFAKQPVLQQNISSKLKILNPTVAETPDTVLSLYPNSVSLVATKSAYIAIQIDTGRNHINSVQIELAYDPRVFGRIQVVPGPFFENPVIVYAENNMRSGRATYVLRPASNASVTGSGIVASLEVDKQKQATMSASTIVQILPKSVVTAHSIPFSLLKLAKGAVLQLQ